MGRNWGGRKGTPWSDERKVRENIRRQCLKLAEEIGCEVVGRRGHPNEHVVFGPVELYGPNYSGTGTGDGLAVREEPEGTTKICQSWSEVLQALEAFQEDLLLAALGIRAGSLSAEVLRSCPLWEPWWRSGEWDRGLVLCDWLEESGQDSLAGEIRGRVRVRTDGLPPYEG
jgi:hypothetical protein